MNKLYCTNVNNSQNIYFVQFQTNSVLYKAQIDVYFMPSATNAALYGYQVAPGATWTFPSVNTMVRITINDNLKTYFGTSQITFGIITPAQNMNYLSDVSKYGIKKIWDQENRPLEFIDKELTLFLIVQTD